MLTFTTLALGDLLAPFYPLPHTEELLSPHLPPLHCVDFLTVNSAVWPRCMSLCIMRQKTRQRKNANLLRTCSCCMNVFAGFVLPILYSNLYQMTCKSFGCLLSCGPIISAAGPPPPPCFPCHHHLHAYKPLSPPAGLQHS